MDKTSEYVKTKEDERGDFRYERKEKATVEDLEAAERETLQRVDLVLSWKSHGRAAKAESEAALLGGTEKETPPPPKKAAENTVEEALAERDRPCIAWAVSSQ